MFVIYVNWNVKCWRTKSNILVLFYCLIVEEHKQQLLREREYRYNKKRDPKYKLFYNSNAWKLLKSRKMMNEQYRCERCRRLATKYTI